MRSGKATLLGSDTLAGSSTNLLEEVRNLVRYGISLEDAIYAATTAPAKAVQLDHRIGRIAAGMQADLLILNKKLELEAVYVDGKRIS
jgi:N-acetylglucosamine-6-phosphate deacetylase